MFKEYILFIFGMILLGIAASLSNNNIYYAPLFGFTGAALLIISVTKFIRKCNKLE